MARVFIIHYRVRIKIFGSNGINTREGIFSSLKAARTADHLAKVHPLFKIARKKNLNLLISLMHRESAPQKIENVLICEYFL